MRDSKNSWDQLCWEHDIAQLERSRVSVELFSALAETSDAARGFVERNRKTIADITAKYPCLKNKE